MLGDHFFGRATRADVLRPHQHGVAPAEENPLRRRFHFYNRAVLAHVPPAAMRGQLRGSVLHHVEQARNVFRRAHVGEPHSEHFLAGVAVMLDGGGVDFKELQGLQVEDVHRLRIGGEKQLKVRVVEGRICAAEFRGARGSLPLWPD